jgi:hypothetical protein
MVSRNSSVGASCSTGSSCFAFLASGSKIKCFRSSHSLEFVANGKAVILVR